MEDTTCDNATQKENDLFYFESDHLALKGNKDYSELLKTLFILTAQRERALKDYEKVQKFKKEALENPGEFIEALKNEKLDIPPLQTIAQIPYINWYSYNTKIPEDELKAIYSDKIKETIEHFAYENKSTTHKQPWTTEEQKRLEELLVIHPPEPVELRRIKKIAADLGNRTVQQVSSRLQKYYLKLHKAGLHVPGRLPKATNFQKNKYKHHKHNNIWKPTTFFPDYNVPVHFDESEDTPGPSESKPTSPVLNKTPSNSNYLIPTSGYHINDVEEKSENQLMLELLRRIRSEKIKEKARTMYKHLTYKCDYCEDEPILGTRWHCSTCIHDSVDFCTDCLLSQLYSNNPHPVAHRFVTLPISDECDNNSSESEGENEISKNTFINETSDNSSSCSSNTLNFQKNGGVKNENFEVDTFLNGIMYNDEKDDDVNNYSTQDISYNYLRENISMNE